MSSVPQIRRFSRRDEANQVQWSGELYNTDRNEYYSNFHYHEGRVECVPTSICLTFLSMPNL